ncbi:MAG: FGGY-family carbohydrate kinase [Candidatus Baldrarchaeia archaeon]
MGEEYYLLGIDVGSTNIKSVIFNLSGKEIAICTRKMPLEHPFPNWVERDMNLLWAITRDVIKQSIKKSSIEPSKIIGVGVCGQGDGLYLLDKNGHPVRKGILSIDTRATEYLLRWEKENVIEELFPIIGQKPHAGAPLTLLAWLKEKEPDNFSKIKWIVFCKDYIKYKLTGVICTDETDSSATLTDIHTRNYSDKIFEAVGLEECKDKLPRIIPAWKKCGEITKEASEETGIPEGTTVCSGLHDVDATGLGAGCVSGGQLLIILGTWEINQIILDDVTLDPSKKCITRVYALPKKWLLMNPSPAATSNLDWFIDNFCKAETVNAEDDISPHKICDREVETVPLGSEGVFYLPFLYGKVDEPWASAAFYGVKGKHTRKHLLRSIYEGVAYSTLMCIQEMEKLTEIKETFIAGGGSRSKIWVKIMSNVLNLPLKVPVAVEIGAKGAAMCAGVSAGVFKDLVAAVDNLTSTYYVEHPTKNDTEQYKHFYSIWAGSVKLFSSIWKKIK